MAAPAVVFDRVWKKFQRGERHDSLRDLVTSTATALFRRSRPQDLSAEEFWAVEDVSFEVKPGEAFGIIGPNGAGKSTSLKLLTRILRPTLGRCEVKGRVGALIEVAAGFHPDLTGRENVFLQGTIMGMRRQEISARLDEIIDFSGIDAFIDTPVKRYSSGMNARLGFSIAAHLRPDVLVIDEVLSVGDAAFQQKCVERMMRFKRDGVAIVFVSHNLQAVATLCETAIHLKHKAIASGATPDVLRHYLESNTQQIQQTEGSASIRSAALLTLAGDEIDSADAGDPLVLRVHYRLPVQELRLICLGIVVRRSTDNLLVYDANFTPDEVIPKGFRASDNVADFVVDYRLSANLTRGHYRFDCHVQHVPTQDFLAYLSPACHLAVSETRTCSGIADLGTRIEPVEAPRRAPKD